MHRGTKQHTCDSCLARRVSGKQTSMVRRHNPTVPGCPVTHLLTRDFCYVVDTCARVLVYAMRHGWVAGRCVAWPAASLWPVQPPVGTSHRPQHCSAPLTYGRNVPPVGEPEPAAEVIQQQLVQLQGTKNTSRSPTMRGQGHTCNRTSCISHMHVTIYTWLPPSCDIRHADWT